MVLGEAVIDGDGGAEGEEHILLLEWLGEPELEGEVVLGLLHEQGVVVVIGDEEPLVGDHLGAWEGVLPLWENCLRCARPVLPIHPTMVLAFHHCIARHRRARGAMACAAHRSRVRGAATRGAESAFRPSM